MKDDNLELNKVVAKVIGIGFLACIILHGLMQVIA